MKNFLCLFFLNEVVMSSLAAQFWSPGCTTLINGEYRNCCAQTGLCQDSNCQVFGFLNSVKTSCQPTESTPNCPNVYCGWAVPACSTTSDGYHCYGTVRCTDGSTSCCASGGSCNDYGAPCLEDGGDGEFKVCGKGTSCSNDGDCPTGYTCQGTTPNGECVGPAASPSPSSSPSPSPGNVISVGGQEQCKACQQGSRTPQCQAADQQSYSMGYPSVDIPGCNFNALQQALQAYNCEIVAGCNSLVCDEVPDSLLRSAITSCQRSYPSSAGTNA